MLCIDSCGFAASPVWRQDDVWAGPSCFTGAHYTRGKYKLASQVADLVDYQGNLVWPV
jgi:hypothetical protein